MARPNKSPAFAIYEDAHGSATPKDQQYEPHTTPSKASNAVREPTTIGGCYEEEEEDDNDDEEGYEDLETESILEDALELAERERYEAAEISRRISAMTGTSVSSLPESLLEVDLENTLPMHEPYSPPLIRPSFRRPESVRRMQMKSPPPLERSPRRPVLHHTRSRTGTPRSGRRSSLLGGTPRSSVHLEEEPEPENAKKDFPLVLLHVTLLPIKLSWSYDIIEETLSPKLMDRCRLLKSKITETILQRGILIPHPQEDYELLEERILEALELINERVTKCGHFQPRFSTSSSSSTNSARDSDSGLGSSVDDADAEACETCQHEVKLSNTATGKAGQKWTVKVFAANGLMRASAWATAWSEMERIDVEILPFIDEELRRQLDTRMEAKEAEQKLQVQSEENKVQDMVESRLLLAQQRYHYDMAQRHAPSTPSPPYSPNRHAAAVADKELNAHPRNSFGPSLKSGSPRFSERDTQYPPIYRPSEIPLSILLKNYVYLLAQDRKNVAIFALSALALWMSLVGMTTSRRPNSMAVLASSLDGYEPFYPSLDSASDVYISSSHAMYEDNATSFDGTGDLVSGTGSAAHIAAYPDVSASSINSHAPNMATSEGQEKEGEMVVVGKSSRRESHLKATNNWDGLCRKALDPMLGSLQCAASEY